MRMRLWGTLAAILVLALSATAVAAARDFDQPAS